jgi:cytochrome c5
MLKLLLLFAAVVALTFTAASATVGPPQEASSAGGAKSSTKMSPEALAKAKKLYNLDCALCHGANGDGKTDLAKDMQLEMLDWTDPKSLANMSDQQLFDEIRKGKGKMPPEDDARAKNDDVKNLVIYIRKMAGAPAAPAATPAPAAAPEPSATPAQPAPPAPSSR